MKDKIKAILHFFHSRRVNIMQGKKLRTYVIFRAVARAVVLCIVVSLLLVYHENEITVSYELGYSNGYTRGENDGYNDGYKDGNVNYQNIKDKYDFYYNNAVIVTTTGNKYHRYGCYHVRNCSYYIYNIELAKGKGYTPCLDCN